MITELAKYCTRLHMGWGEVGHKLFCGDFVEISLKSLQILPKAFNVVERDLYCAVVDFAKGIHFLLLFPSC